MPKYTTLGRTGLNVATISFGGIPIQRDDVNNTIKIVDRLEQLEMNYIDTARAYTVSEEYLGEALKGRREKFILATKSLSRDYDSMKADIETSLANFQTDYIDIYQIHNIKEPDFEIVFGDNGAYKALLEAKSNKKIGFIGITIHSIDVLKKVVEEYHDIMDTVMFPFNIVELQGEELLTKARELGMGTIIMKPLAGGNLDDYELALRFIANSECCDISIPGMGNVEEVDKNASVWNNERPLSEQEVQETERIREELGTNFCRRCGYCMPCTAGIDIPANFLMLNYLKRYEGLSDWARSRFATFQKTGKDCVNCGKCEVRCPYDLPIIEMLQETVRAFYE